MSTLRLILWLLIAWPLPALLAGAMGWSGVWGSGSALVDYLIPLPVAGGVLHVPSFVVCGWIAWQLPSASASSQSKWRALLFGAALAGLLLLLRLDELLLAAQTQSSRVGSLWHENPVGLFVLCDALVALLFTAAVSQGPWLRLELRTLLLVLVPAAVPLGLALKYSKAGEDFRYVAARPGPSRSDEITMVFTRLNVHGADFQARAEAWAALRHPRLTVDSDDAAILFTTNLDAARNFDTRQVAATLCLYDDGTPSKWVSGAGIKDCFDGHVSFSERFSQAHAARPSTEPPDVRHYMARITVCDDVKPIAPGGGGDAAVQTASLRICSGLAEAREALVLKHPEWATVPVAQR
jgi:hypothetical protein